MKKVLFAWLGNTDIQAAENGKEMGPVAMAAEERSFSFVYLLCSYPEKRLNTYKKWFTEQFPGKELSVLSVKLSSPTNYSEIYESVVNLLNKTVKGNGEMEMTFHLSPGTPAMAAVWIIIAQTIFPADLIESSREAGVRDVDFPFVLSADYIPRLNKKIENRIIDFSEGLPPDTPEFGMIIYKSARMERAVMMAKRSALFNVPLLLTGESGTGKELFARAVWSLSDRSDKPFVPVNCGAIPETLAESELFGYVKGSFTGAGLDRMGKIQAADGGILFLDEIGELPKEIQVKLLRALQEKVVYPVGSSKGIPVDFRLVSAANRDLLNDVKQGRFRADFFHRIAVNLIRLPALRERMEDLDVLADYYLDEINKEFRNQKGWTRKMISDGGRRAMAMYSWPGNVRELVNTIMRMCIWTRGSVITSEDVEYSLFSEEGASFSKRDSPLAAGFSLQEVIGEIASEYLNKALKETGGNKTKAAGLLGFNNYQTLSNWMKKYGVIKAD